MKWVHRKRLLSSSRFLHYLDAIHLGLDKRTHQQLAEDFPWCARSITRVFTAFPVIAPLRDALSGRRNNFTVGAVAQWWTLRPFCLVWRSLGRWCDTKSWSEPRVTFWFHASLLRRKWLNTDGIFTWKPPQTPAHSAHHMALSKNALNMNLLYMIFGILCWVFKECLFCTVVFCVSKPLINLLCSRKVFLSRRNVFWEAWFNIHDMENGHCVSVCTLSFAYMTQYRCTQALLEVHNRQVGSIRQP